MVFPSSKWWCVRWCLWISHSMWVWTRTYWTHWLLPLGRWVEHPNCKLFWCSPGAQPKGAGRWRPCPTTPLSRPTSNASKWSTGAATPASMFFFVFFHTWESYITNKKHELKKEKHDATSKCVLYPSKAMVKRTLYILYQVMFNSSGIVKEQ